MGGVGAVEQVAYVEGVSGSRGSYRITLSENANPGSPYDWMTISQGDSRWPGGFIYFSNLASASTHHPAVVQRSNGETDVLAVGSDGALYYWNALGSPSWNQLTVAASGVK